jgi:uncharacterized protein YqkB
MNMKMTFTDSAAEQLSRTLDSRDSLKLAYDTEGCGCAVNGVPQLSIVDVREPGSDEVRMDSERFTVWADPRQMVFFDDELTLDFRPESGTYRLKSANQIFGASMRLMDKRSHLAEKY